MDHTHSRFVASDYGYPLRQTDVPHFGSGWYSARYHRPRLIIITDEGRGGEEREGRVARSRESRIFPDPFTSNHSSREFINHRPTPLCITLSFSPLDHAFVLSLTKKGNGMRYERDTYWRWKHVWQSMNRRGINVYIAYLAFHEIIQVFILEILEILLMVRGWYLRSLLLVCLLRSRSTDMGKFETVGDIFWNIVSSFVEENYFVSWRIIYSFLIFLINHPLSLIPENFCQVLSLFRRRELIIFEEISFQNLQDCWWQSLVVKDSFFLNMNDAFNWSNRV